jgi:cytochrome P450
MSTLHDFPSVPFVRQDVLDLAPQTHYLIRNHPIARVRTFVGSEVWVVTGYEYVKSLFNDERLGRSHHDPGNATRISNFYLLSGPVGSVDTERDELVRMRTLLAPAFSIRRIRALEGHVTAIVDALLEGMSALEPPVDLHEVLSYPLSVRVICELLGVPFDDRDRFQGWAYDLDSFDDVERATAAYLKFTEYLHGLIQLKRDAPGEDVISDLIAAERQWELTPDDIALYALILLFAGHPSTAANIDVGTVFLLTHPDQRIALTREDGLVAGAVEEILRIVPLGSKFGQLRYAHADIAIGGVTIARGDGVLLMNGAANRDPCVFTEPNRLDITREENAHLSFGVGPRRCLGANLARLELNLVFRKLFQRFPDLRLVEPVEQLEIDKTHMVERLVRLLVTW